MHRRSCALAAASLSLIAAACPVAAGPGKQTVCTITINSADEREAFRRNLPADRFDFVELLERGRPDWLASACSARVKCDVLVISGHFDDGSEFYSDRVDSHDRLPVAELERAACTNACSGLFSQLKEVYLFGCNTMNADALHSASGEAVRSLVRAGYSPDDANALARALEARHGESNRDRMRVVFKDAPVIYGFSSKAPLGAYAGPLLERYFKGGGASDFGQGRISAPLLSLFAPASMKSASGVTDTDLQAEHRADVCSFVDDAGAPADRIRFVHALLSRGMAEVQMYLDRLDTLTGALPSIGESADARALAEDVDARRRYLEVARDADSLATATRMLTIAGRIGWLSDAAVHREFLALVDARARRNVLGADDVDLVCSSSARRQTDPSIAPALPTAAYADSVANAATLACLGHADRRARALRGLLSDDERDVQIAQVYLQYRPLRDAAELRALTAAVARMRGGATQVRALQTLAAMGVSDRESLATLTALYPRARSLDVQRAIAGVLIRADAREIAPADFARTLRQYRLASPDGEDVIDALIRRLQASS